MALPLEYKIKVCCDCLHSAATTLENKLNKILEDNAENPVKAREMALEDLYINKFLVLLPLNDLKVTIEKDLEKEIKRIKKIKNVRKIESDINNTKPPGKPEEGL